MFFEKIKNALNRIGENRVRRAELAANRANKRNSLRTAFEQRKSGAAQTPAQKVRRIQRELSLKFQLVLNSGFHDAHRHLLQHFPGNARRTDRAKHLVFPIGKQKGFCRTDTVERFRLAFSAIFNRITLNRLHFLNPRIDGFRILHGFETRHKFLKRHFREIRRMVIAQNLLIRVIIRRRKQFSREAAFRNHGKIPLRSFNLNGFHRKELVLVLRKNIRERIRLVQERHAVGNADNELRRGLGGNARIAFARQRLNRNRKAFRLFQNQICDFKQRVSARRIFNRLGKNPERFFLRKKRNFNHARRGNKSCALAVAAMRRLPAALSARRRSVRMRTGFRLGRDSALPIARRAAIPKTGTGAAFPPRSRSATIVARNPTDGNLVGFVSRSPRRLKAKR